MASTPLEIEVWETEYPLLLIWGTHDLRMARRGARKYYTETVHEIPEGLDTELFEAKLFWGDPSLRDMEVEEPWPSEKLSNVPAKGWIPFMAIDWS